MLSPAAERAFSLSISLLIVRAADLRPMDPRSTRRWSTSRERKRVKRERGNEREGYEEDGDCAREVRGKGDDQSPVRMSNGESTSPLQRGPVDVRWSPAAAVTSRFLANFTSSISFSLYSSLSLSLPPSPLKSLRQRGNHSLAAAAIPVYGPWGPHASPVRPLSLSLSPAVLRQRNSIFVTVDAVASSRRRRSLVSECIDSSHARGPC